MANLSFSDLIAKRYSVRAYRPDPFEPEKLEKILVAAQLAPTAANRQPFQIIVIQTKGRTNELLQIYDREWFVQAPLVICVCGIPDQGWVRYDGANYTLADVAIVMDHITLAATDLDLGTCWVASFDIDAAKKILGLPKGVEPMAFTPLGYSADTPGSKARKSISALVRYENW